MIEFPPPPKFILNPPAIIRPKPIDLRRASFLPGMAAGIRVGGVSTPTGPFVWYAGTDVITTNGSSYSFTNGGAGWSIGPADADRILVLGLLSSSSTVGTGRTFNAVTVDGNAATIINQSRQDNVGSVGLARIGVAAGTTIANVTFTMSGTSLAGRVLIWYGYPASAVPLDSGGATDGVGGNILSINDLSVQPGGFVVALHGTSARTLTWNGIDSMAQDFSGSVENYSTEGYSISTTENNTGRDLTLDSTGRLHAASWV